MLCVLGLCCGVERSVFYFFLPVLVLSSSVRVPALHPSAGAWGHTSIFSGLLFLFSRVRLKSRGDRAFAVVGPRLWNNLPLHVRKAQTLTVFKSSLKNYFYSLAFNTV